VGETAAKLSHYWRSPSPSLFLTLLARNSRKKYPMWRSSETKLATVCEVTQREV
jgi:hypothetical protein